MCSLWNIKSVFHWPFSLCVGLGSPSGALGILAQWHPDDPENMCSGELKWSIQQHWVWVLHFGWGWVGVRLGLREGWVWLWLQNPEVIWEVYGQRGSCSHLWNNRKNKECFQVPNCHTFDWDNCRCKTLAKWYSQLKPTRAKLRCQMAL